MKKLKFILPILLVGLFAGTAYAKHDGANAGGGGQVKRPDLSAVEVTLPDGTVCVEIAAAGIDLNDCEVIPASGTSYLTQVICPETTAFVCPTE